MQWVVNTKININVAKTYCVLICSYGSLSLSTIFPLSLQEYTFGSNKIIIKISILQKYTNYKQDWNSFNQSINWSIAAQQLSDSVDDKHDRIEQHHKTPTNAKIESNCVHIIVHHQGPQVVRGKVCNQHAEIGEESYRKT